MFISENIKVELISQNWIATKVRTAAAKPGNYPFELRDAGLYLGVRASVLRHALVEGHLNGRKIHVCYRCGRSIYFLRSELDEIIGKSSVDNSFPLPKLIEFLMSLPLTNKQRADVLDINADTFSRWNKRRPATSKHANINRCEDLMNSWNEIGPSILRCLEEGMSMSEAMDSCRK